ncbi:TolC family protein [Stenotrophomonas sp. CPCC 101365]|uniref:TolC family protein n=2 Tax=Stenotrophomonas mori TaxID=2871096 RepID=A0ABT0SH52_9GAMM|nr:TolC family protein [Stenotrophomonas mori]
MTLAEAEAALHGNNADILAARIELRGAEGDLFDAARRPAAELSVGSSKISRQEGVGGGRWKDKRVDSTLGVEWTWERGGKRRLRVEGARARGDAARLDLLDQRSAQVLALHEAYFGLKAAQQALQMAEDNRDEAARALAAAERALATGAIAPIERNRLAVEAMKAEAEARGQRLEWQDAQIGLALLIGHVDAPERLQAEDPWPAAGTPAPLPDGFDPALRADLQAVAARVRAADAERRLVRSQGRRDVQLGLELEREPDDIGGVTLGFSVSVPLVGARHYRGQVQRAEADYDAAVLAQREADRQVRAQVRQAGGQLEAAGLQVQHYEQRIAPAARQALDGMELAYRRGAASLTDLLDARRTWREAEHERVQAQLEHAVARARWQALLTLPSLQGS